jgi:hypothetical protein
VGSIPTKRIKTCTTFCGVSFCLKKNRTLG